MNTQTLIEQTVLYTLGFLDADEEAAYEASLAAAPAEIRACVRAEAARMADLGDLLPDENPGPEVREMVLAAVRAGMREQEVEQRIVAGRITPETPAPRRYSQPALPRSRRVHPVWRAAAIGFIAATIVLTIDSARSRTYYQNATEGARIAGVYDATGPGFLDAALFDANTRRVILTPASSDTNAAASVWHNPDWGPTARLFVKNLKPQPGQEPYRLVVLDAEGNVVREVAQFRPTGEIQDISVTVNLATESRLAIYQSVREALDAQPVLRSPEVGL